MGLFQKIRYNRRAKKAGVYGVVAQNMAAMYYAIPFTPYGSQLTERQRLAAAALIDMVAYYNEGKVTPKTLAEDIQAAENGVVSLVATTTNNGVLPTEENAKLIAVTMQIMARMLKISGKEYNLYYGHIIDPIIMNKPVFASMINETLAEGTRSEAYSDCIALVKETCAIPEFQAIINKF